MPDTHSKIRLRRVSPLGAGLLAAAAAFLVALVGSVFFLIISAAGMAAQNSPGMAEVGAAGTGFLIAAVIIYPIMGFIAGFLYAAIFNLVAPMIGGLELTVSGLNPETESEQVWKDV
ncbi:MAG: hypothetical protein H6831_08060 [Planctomycetes bacterium]|nr:hypothetical protein [Planctomycetota bacterium]MCB9904345.1 hypothetical protein [Planctomycetota bacterium]